MAAVAGGRITAGVGANLIGQHAADRNQDATVYVGGLDPQVIAQLLLHCKGLYLSRLWLNVWFEAIATCPPSR